MKKNLIAFTALFFFAFCNDCFAQMKKGTDNPYKAVYSSSFTIGNAAYAKKVLELWKDYDDNAFDRHDYLADTVVMFLPDGTISKGKADNLDGVKKFRSTFSTVKSTVLAWCPLTSTDRHEDAVCIWGFEDDTSPDGNVERKDIHEVWWFNKAGKITMMRQWTAKFGE